MHIIDNIYISPFCLFSKEHVKNLILSMQIVLPITIRTQVKKNVISIAV